MELKIKLETSQSITKRPRPAYTPPLQSILSIETRIRWTLQHSPKVSQTDSPKLAMEHGFIQTIIKNQVDRDEYNKEQKAISLQKTKSGQSRSKKRASLQMYVPPHLRAKAVDVKNKQESESSSKGKKHIFLLHKRAHA